MLDAAGRRSVGLSLLIALQSFCIVFFVVDVIDDAVEGIVPSLHLVVEGLANLALVAAVAIEVRILRDSAAPAGACRPGAVDRLGGAARCARRPLPAMGADPVRGGCRHLHHQGLLYRRDRAAARLGQGTVKTHLNAIYRKSGLSGRGQLASLLIEDLLNPAHPGAATGRPAEEAAA